MTKKEFSVFQNVANNEDSITELLTNFLYFKSFRDLFFSQFLPNLNLCNEITHEDLSTQQSIKNFRPDIVISTDTFEIFFEVKVQDAPLMETQKSDYQAYLNDLTDKQTHLCFIIPIDYHELQTLQNLAKQKDVSIIFWPEIIKLIVTNQLSESSQLFNEFYKFLKYWFEPKRISFSNKQLKLMYSKEIPEITTKLYSLIDEVKKRILGDERLHVSKTKTSSEFGFYVDDKENNGFLFFGIWYEQWLNNGYPLCYTSQKAQANNEVTKLFQKHFPDYESCAHSIIAGVKEHEMDEEVVKTISDKINEYIRDCLALSNNSNSN